MTKTTCVRVEVAEREEAWPPLHVVGRPDEEAAHSPRTWVIYEDTAGAGIEFLVREAILEWRRDRSSWWQSGSSLDTFPFLVYPESCKL